MNKYHRCCKAWIFVLCFSLLGRFTFAREFKDGRIKLVLYEQSGRFSLYYLQDIDKERYTPLFVDKDPRTSYLTLLVNDTTYRLGESSIFRIMLDETNPLSPALVFDSPAITVRQVFSFIRVGDTVLSNGIRMDVQIINKGEKDIRGGLRFLLDTNLGEEGDLHFYTAYRQIKSEILLETAAPDAYWVSEGKRGGLMGSFFAFSPNSPSSVLFVNWKRIHDLSWNIKVSPGRSFTYLPYSVNDSAVCYFFDPQLIKVGQSRTCTLALAVPQPGGFETVKSSEGLSRVFSEAYQGTNNSQEDLKRDLLIIEDVLKRLDVLLKEQGTLSAEDIATIKQILTRMEEKYPGN
ncbi:MAG: hypothetical protein N2Z76_02835 [Treponemataceae bacterium]|nr:hypothetical protein [Treponemataceae bacterium]